MDATPKSASKPAPAPPVAPSDHLVRVIPPREALPLRAAVAEPPRGPRKVAVIVTHGMGSQVPFETLQSVASRLLPYSVPPGPHALPVAVDLVNMDGMQLPRASLTISDQHHHPLDVHFYEAYWAPLTEGKVTARDSLWFLFMAGLRGILGLRFSRFRRWMFGDWQSFPVARWKLALYFLAAVLTIGSVVVMNLAIAGVVASQSLTAGISKWPSNALLSDLTGIIGFFEGRMILYLGLGLALPMFLRWLWMKLKRPFKLPIIFKWFLRACFGITILLTIHTGWLVLRRLVLEWMQGQEGQVRPVTWVPASTPGWVADLLHRSREALTGLWHTAGSVLSWARPELRWLFGGIRFSNSQAAVPLAKLLTVWVLAVTLAYVVRWFLREYVGDVAAYVSSYALSKFDELRNQIQKLCFDVMRAVYRQRNAAGSGFEYEEIVVVGHSLGSVIAYDTVNALLNDKPVPLPAGVATPARPLPPLEVPRRTKTLLTFGSPLDKTAYVFRLQRPEQNEIREALAAAKQPLILDYVFRPNSWVNLFSKDDWISGSLEFYDTAPGNPPLPGGTKRVQNLPDPEACIPLAGHTFYWKSELFTTQLYEAVISVP